MISHWPRSRRKPEYRDTDIGPLTIHFRAEETTETIRIGYVRTDHNLQLFDIVSDLATPCSKPTFQSLGSRCISLSGGANEKKTASSVKQAYVFSTFLERIASLRASNSARISCSSFEVGIGHLLDSQGIRFRRVSVVVFPTGCKHREHLTRGKLGAPLDACGWECLVITRGLCIFPKFRHSKVNHRT